ncbi:hypothetical protein [Pseudomonas sp. Irchel 3E20]|uniref:hypothetical protein n=1 Tax=Pseudomonas sp. Irchel 3E20 TaxID=2008983 RepID=UPI000BA48EA7|nr:hypothetical protein [Pseudomonas sp. Irchel 3E20]
MTDYSELKRLAEACIAAGEYLPGEAWEEDRSYCQAEVAFLEFVPVATPAAVQALIAESERLKTLRSATERDLAQELEVWRSGPSCWSCGDTGDVHDIVGEWRGQCDCNAAKLIDVASERDQLKAENERQAAQYKEWQASHHANYCKVAEERDELRAENAGLKTGYEAYEQVNAELKAEVEGLRKLGPSKEIIWCACGDGYPVNSHGAGFMDANNGVCANCDAALGQGEQS